MKLEAHPFPHIVCDNTARETLCAEASAQWPDRDWPHWFTYDETQQHKRSCRDWSAFPPAVRLLLSEMLLSSVPGLFHGLPSIPSDLLWGGGMCDMRQGDYLNRHLDHDRHALTGLERTASLILFVGDDWQSDWGGRLQFWKEDCEEPVIQIDPLPGRLVCFATTENAWHSVETVRYSHGQSRKTLSCYWYATPLHRGHRPRAQFALEPFGP